MTALSTSVRRMTPSWLASIKPSAPPSRPQIAPLSTRLLSTLSLSTPSPVTPWSPPSLSSIPSIHSPQYTQPLQSPQSLQPHQTIRHRSNRSRRGLYDGKDVQFGNNVPFSLKKTRRKWSPNMFIKRVYSEILDEMIPFHITTSALRSIDKAGGLDNYLLTSRHVATGDGEGQRVRNRIVQKMRHRAQLKKEAIARGESVEDWDRIELIGKKIKTEKAE